MSKKINVKTARAEEFQTVKGIGKAKSEKIAHFLESGGSFNSIEEFQRVANIQPVYLEEAKAVLDFGKVEFAKPISPVYEGVLGTMIPFEPEPLKSFSFKVLLSGLENDAIENPYEGYKLMVEYRILSKTYSKTFTPNKEGEIEIKLFAVSLNVINSNMKLVVTSPDNSIIYDTRFDIMPDEEIGIKLLSYFNQDLQLKVKKQDNVNYNNYKIKITTKLNRGVDGTDTIVNSYDISNTSEIDILYDTFSEVLEILVQAISGNGEVFVSKNYKWKDIEEEDGLKKLELILPDLAKDSFDIQLVEDPEELTNPYLDHKAAVSFDLKDPILGEVIRRIEKVFVINAKGQAKVCINHYGGVENILLEIKAPGGEVIGKRTIELSEIADDNEVEVRVPPRKLAGIEGIETLPVRPKKVVGRVIDASGTRKFVGVQVILYAATKKEPQDKDFVPIVIAKTENDGYFQVNTPVGYFTSAFGMVGIPKKGNTEGEVFEIPIRLEEDTITLVKDGETYLEKKLFFPAHIILVVDSEIEDDEECNCNDCNLDFHKDKQVVDEFSYFSVVRTTEPAIQGYTLEEDGEMSIQEIIDIVPLDRDSNGTETIIPTTFRKERINQRVLSKYINDKKGLTFTTLKKALNESNAQKLRKVIKPQRQVKAFGRHLLNLDSSIDWDKDPTIYQATSISHGHLLQFKQEWVADGYSMGDLLYSLPLAPGQKKQIVVYDWERRESAAKSDSLDYQESLYNTLSRDRDINEIVNGSLNENVKGGSSSRTGSFGGGFGVGAIFGSVGALLGVSGGSSKSSSKAWQNSSRRTSLNDMQSLRDRTVQSATSVRSQRGTVVQSATQGERFSVETEVVANYNHCHSLTIQYFEVLRHLKVQHRLSSVQEALFVPLIMSVFDYQKILRWREILERYVWSRRLRRGFDAIERIENDYEGSDLPKGSFSEETINHLEGHMYLEIDIPSPVDLNILEEKEKLTEAMSGLLKLFPGIQRQIDEMFEKEANKRNAYFSKYVAPRVAHSIVEKIRFKAVVESGVDGTESRVELPLDTTLISDFNNGGKHYVSIRQNEWLGGVSRHGIKAIEIDKASKIELPFGLYLRDVLPAHTRVIIHSGTLRYRTDHHSDNLFRKSSIKDDLIGFGGMPFEKEFVRIATPLNRSELRNPRNEDSESANAVQDHLNDNMEFFHKAIWMNMSPERRFMFLDGIQVTDYSESENYPLGVVRSVASVVENKVIGIIGNSLVMPVAPGFRLDPNSKGNDVDLISLYQPITPIEPVNLSIPTKGVFAEAVMGKCNSCEEIDDSRFWRWSEEPLPDSPTPIGTVSTDTRRTTPLDSSSSPFPNSVLNIQNAPAAPDPSGLTQAANLLQNAKFNDITGLEQNQKNTIEGLKASLKTAQAFGTKAADMAALGAQIESIDKARKNRLIDKDTAKKQTEAALKNYNSGKAGDLAEQLKQVKSINDAVKNGEITKDAGEKLTNKAITGSTGSQKKVTENPAIIKKIEEAETIEYETEEETIKVSREAAIPVDTNLLKFIVNFRKPRTFKWSTGAVVNYDGHFGFDWLRDEYQYPMLNVLGDLEGNPLNKLAPICTDVAKLKAEYLKDDPSPITPHGHEYIPSWLSIMPYTRAEDFPHGSIMHKHGVKLSLEIEEIDVLAKHDNTLELKVVGPAEEYVKISPTSISLTDVLDNAKRKELVLDASKAQTRTRWILEDFVTVKCVGNAIEDHAEIVVEAVGSNKTETVGKLMVYANKRIPKAEIVMVRFSYTGENVNLAGSYHSILKNNSFNQALIRAEILEDEKFVLNDLDGADADVIAFKAAYPDGTAHNSENFLNDLLKLYEKFGANFPDLADKRTVMFITDQNASDAGGLAEGNEVVKGLFEWGNAVVVFGSNLKDENTFVHEIGHSLSLPHTFETSNMTGANVKHRYHMGYTDNIMDYDERYDGTAAKNTINGLYDKKYFYKWQWDVMRTDQSLKDEY